MHVSDDGPLRLEAFDPGQRVADAEMAGMAGVAQAVDNPEIEVFQRGKALLGNVVQVGRIGCAADPKTERGNLAMMNQEASSFTGRPSLRWWPLAGLDRMARQDRR